MRGNDGEKNIRIPAFKVDLPLYGTYSPLEGYWTKKH